LLDSSAKICLGPQNFFEQETPMQLWTEYEGLTIEGAFPLKKLLLPEGRSAFFSTANGNGEPVLVRLIECHFDQEEILARWRSLQALGHPNFLKLDQFGKLVLDDGPVVYAVFEKADANLAEVLDRGGLNKDDVIQIAVSVAGALDVLHTHGFVHEHMEAGNVFAVGEVVKLRVDCIREAPEGEAGAAAKQRDVHGLATLLLQALTQKRTLQEAAKAAPLPPPFDQIVRYGITGAWSLTEIKAALDRIAPPRAASPAPQAVRTRAAVQPGSQAAGSQAPASSAAASSAAGSSAAIPNEIKAEKEGSEKPISSPAEKIGDSRPSGISARAQAAPKAEPRPEARRSGEAVAERRPSRFEQQALDFDRLPAIPRHVHRREREDFPLKNRWLGAAVLLVVVCIAIGWLYARVHRGHSAPVEAPSSARHNGTAQTPRKQRASNASAAIAPRKSPAAGQQGPQSRSQWRVIAYTYERADQAQKKAAALAAKYPGLRPAVFSPTGRRPFLVTLGGAMDRDQAYALARKLRRSGLPRDTYAQNYRTAR
jgi:hypothetical protein